MCNITTSKIDYKTTDDNLDLHFVNALTVKNDICTIAVSTISEEEKSIRNRLNNL